MLLDAHFPEPSSTLDMPLVDRVMVGHVDDRLASSIVSLRKLTWAIGGFEPYKSAGPDGIIPAQLQQSLYITCGWLNVIFRKCLVYGHLPEIWKRTRVVFIPKAGKCSHSGVKDFRPISLSSFVLKTFEKLLDLHIRSTIPRELLSGRQHAYMRGRSTETALHSLVEEIETALHRGEFALGAFLDIEGAFNNILPYAVVEALRDLGVESYIISLVAQLLENRTISAEWGDAVMSRAVCRGTPQGGVLSPLLWLVTLNTLLVKLEREGCWVIAYADDLAIVTRGKFVNVVMELMTYHLGTVSDWSVRNGLSLNPGKTETVLFTRRYKVPEFRPPVLNGTVLSLSERVKYLGIILDSKLSWGPNVEERVRKAAVALYCSRAAVGKRWGLSPSSMMWIFATIVRPILYYGVIVWWGSLERTGVLRKLESVQRSALIGISGALRTTPTEALNVFFNIWPPDIAAKYMACAAMLRVRESGVNISHHAGHAGILGKVDVVPVRTDYCISSPMPSARYGTFVPKRDFWRASRDGDISSLRFFTDGSKLNDRVGYGIYSPDLNLKVSRRMPDHCSVFQAEVTAIREVALFLSGCVTTIRRVRIYTDSQSAIRALDSLFVKSRTVKECHLSLAKVAEYFDIRLIWVPGHSDIPGNCIADELARSGTTARLLPEGESVGIPMTTCLLRLKCWAGGEFSSRWRQISTCRQSRELWPSVNRRRTGQLVSLPRRRISAVVGILSGHCLVGRHAVRLGVSGSTLCEYCLEEENTSARHLLLECPALSGLRSRILGGYLMDPGSLLEVPVAHIGRFLVEAGMDPWGI